MDQHSFFFQAMVYLGGAVLFVPLSKKIGLGSVLGYLLAGIVIGPGILGIIGNEGEDIMKFSEFGVVMMLFLIGLEVEPQVLWKLRTQILGLGGLQVLLTTLILTALAMLLGLEWQPALALGCILSLSSTAIVLQTLSEKGLTRSMEGQRAFSVLLFQDLAVIPMLALLPLLATMRVTGATAAEQEQLWTAGLPVWERTLVLLGSVAIIFFGGKYMVRPIFKIVASTKLREIFTATSLLIVVGITVLMEQVGLSPALGTFLAGVVLANSEYKHELESDIEPFKGLFLGVFFISVGASIDYKIIVSQPLVILKWLTLVMFSKALVLFLLGKLFRLRLRSNLLFALALCQVGEFAFVLFTVTGKQGILPPDLIKIMIAVVAISMALTPLVLLVNDRLLQPRIKDALDNSRAADEINEKNPVIIAGLGNFGNIVGRFLRAHNVGATYLEIDADRVELLRKMGFRVYYGDASRGDLLAAAGAAEAKLIIIAIDSPQKRLEMIETIKTDFPNLRMLVRARSRFDAYDLMNAGMLHVYRETLDTSLRVGADALAMLGHRSYTARRSAKTFFKFDENNLKKLAAIRDQGQYISQAKEYIEELEEIIRSEKATLDLQQEEDGEEDSLINEVKTASGIITL